MDLQGFSVDQRVAAGLHMVEKPDKKEKEIWFKSNGKYLFLSSITEEKLYSQSFDMFQHWLEETVINLPPYEKLMEIIELEGSELFE
ncbi:hypothetical protein A8L34_16335 [Bacillus sp. FJAT-27264]|uniref:hypothetical protein n=1 Tax=Paenibacillus sp. (strain DSM 101736 / FJAT-27264) TaxID=1850362 RepID=UPI000807EBD1|nr:hypothetical protein [Bacillus sp. FJAT-27264]OBZ11889.1 hypothetical protein A8L34_16335 [Bacillus sp. FJAT-27264]